MQHDQLVRRSLYYTPHYTLALMGHHRRDRSRPSCSAQAVIALRAFNRRFRLIRVFGQSLSIHLALGFLIEGKAGVAR